VAARLCDSRGWIRSRVSGKVSGSAIFSPRRSRTTASPGEDRNRWSARRNWGPMLWAATIAHGRGPVGCNPPIDPPGVHAEGKAVARILVRLARRSKRSPTTRSGDLREVTAYETTLDRRLSPTSASTCASTIWPRSRSQLGREGPARTAVRPQARRQRWGSCRRRLHPRLSGGSAVCSTGRSSWRPTTPLAGRAVPLITLIPTYFDVAIAHAATSPRGRGAARVNRERLRRDLLEDCWRGKLPPPGPRLDAARARGSISARDASCAALPTEPLLRSAALRAAAMAIARAPRHAVPPLTSSAMTRSSSSRRNRGATARAVGGPARRHPGAAGGSAGPARDRTEHPVRGLARVADAYR